LDSSPKVCEAMTREPRERDEYRRSSLVLGPAPLRSALLMSRELMTIRVPLIDTCPAGVCRHLRPSSRRGATEEPRSLTNGTSQPLKRRVNTTVERKMAGVASSTVGEETARSVRTVPVETLSTPMSQPLDRHCR
jgi:hypothetical protein